MLSHTGNKQEFPNNKVAKRSKWNEGDNHLCVCGAPLHLQPLAADWQTVFFFPFLRVSNTWSSGRLMWRRYPPALRRNDNWAWNVSVWRMPDKQRRSNYTQLLLQMERIKANESYTGQHRGCLMKREWETAEGSVCVSEARSQFSDISSPALLFNPPLQKNNISPWTGSCLQKSAFIVGGSGSPGVEEISLINAPRVSIVINGDKEEEESEGGAGEAG